jgi:serine/threonine protein kinase
MVADRYALDERLGQGGAGVVWKATDTLLKRSVAVKEVEVPAAISSDEASAIKARVLREARAAAALNHPNVVTVYDVIEQDGHTYIVMELVESPTLADKVELEGPMPAAEAAALGLEVLQALELAHNAGIVHRDVKPANVMVGDGVKLADFGIASIKDDPKITASGLIIGSPAFMAPEQALGRTASPSTDLWALGATLYFAVEGRSPFDRGAPIPTLTAVVHETPHPAKAPGPLGGLIGDLLEKDPSLRPPPAEVRRRLEEVAAGITTTDEFLATDVETRVEEPEPTPLPAPPARRAPRRDPWPVLIGLLVLAAIGALVWFGLTRDEPETKAPSATPETRSTPKEQNEPATEEPAQTAVPADWAEYSDPTVGYVIRHPSDWQVVDEEANITDIEDPSSGRYLRIDWTDSPGPSPEGAWYDFEESYSQDHANYQRIQITPTTYQGMDAALWEYTWEDGGVTIHAYNLGFITDDYGFALNFVATEDQWQESGDEWEAFKQSFRMPQS